MAQTCIYKAKSNSEHQSCSASFSLEHKKLLPSKPPSEDPCHQKSGPEAAMRCCVGLYGTKASEVSFGGSGLLGLLVRILLKMVLDGLRQGPGPIFLAGPLDT